MRVQLFGTCMIDTFFPETGMSVMKLLRHFGVDVSYPKGQTCCGKPANSGGYARESRKAAEQFISVFEGSKDPIVTPSGSCASMVKNHYHHLFKDNTMMRDKALAVADRTYELTQFLVHELKVHEAGLSGKGKITYHASCQLTRELGVKEEPLLLLQSLNGAEFIPMPYADRCCGFGGVFMAKMPEISTALADEKLDTVLSTGADTVTGCDHGCLMNIADAVRRRGARIAVKHIATVLAEGLK
ncbi:MAG: (Fe-S)-binding protein [Desulfomonile tiedjei]|uniref:(Fe-S)-binding protein n=1 Tax=Desulfomonile tiedjei TaxID=2358 RepID=A0A9D6Z606_9BACT|nr:(Fe-S)-binding protein [Desulfomonile tiedjei]